MRNIESVMVKKAIVHVLDRNGDEPILTDYEQEIQEDIHEFLEKHIIKSLQDEENRKAKFRGGIGVVKNACQEVFEDEEKFVEGSKVIAEQLFKAMKRNNNISSADLVVCLYAVGDENCIGVLKLDYKKSFIHNVEFIDDKLKISIIPQTISLPGLSQRLQKCAFIKEIDEEDEYDMIVLDKQVYGNDEDGDIAQFFIHDFLNCNILVDNRDKTKLFKRATEKWTRKNLKEDIEKAQEVREEALASLKNCAEIDVEKFSQNVFGNDAEMQQHFIQQLDQEGLQLESFDIDKAWVEKKMKKRVIKTDTGIEIKGEYEDIEDKMKFEIIRNGGGTVNIIIKNVRNFHER
ncbi:nucleoid-associated protein [Marinisporobacter balticus]|uniref:Nucleoid associated protein NdpA n=1 Tax=Marinisporobacter balticus TaxID=2018667 RepID=A0A4R2L5R7_9FIRM|nr:nucleoid-associated protein [Marinisporobacter balticus]TCO79389.1 nucleoid associated protein NdpA [Marinisporobacter balticus]